MKTHNRFKIQTVTFILMVLVLSVFIQNTKGQENNGTVTIVKGKLIDKDSKKPIIFANVFIANTNIGTVSNSEGDFILKIPENVKNKEIKVSYMGYKSISLSLNDFNKPENIITMSPEVVMLKELLVRTNDPINLIRASRNNIPNNYGVNPSICTAFYRECILQNKTYVGVAEAVMDIYKSRYNSDLEQDRIKIFKGRKSQDVKRMDTLIFKLQGGHHVAVLLDLAKNPQSFMDDLYFASYDYKPVTITNIEGKETYVIEFSQKKEVAEAFYEGRIYIDYASLAIKRVEFAISPVGLLFADRYLVKKKPVGTSVKTQSGVYVVDYRDVNGRWTLNHVRYEVKFKVDKKRQLFSKIYTSTVDLAITDKDTVNVSRFKLSESIKPTQVFSDHVNEYFDENFWGSYNIIKPEEPIQEAIDRISKRMKRLKNS